MAGTPLTLGEQVTLAGRVVRVTAEGVTVQFADGQALRFAPQEIQTERDIEAPARSSDSVSGEHKALTSPAPKAASLTKSPKRASEEVAHAPSRLSD